MDRLERLNRLGVIVNTLEDMAINRMGKGSYAQSLAREARMHIEHFRDEHPSEVFTAIEIAEALSDWVRPDGSPITADDIPTKDAEEFALEIGTVYSDGYWARCYGDNWADACEKLASKLGFIESDPCGGSGPEREDFHSDLGIGPSDPLEPFDD